MKDIVSGGLIRQLSVLKYYLSDYKEILKYGILTQEEYDTLNKCVSDIHERLTLQSIDKERDKEIRLWLR